MRRLLKLLAVVLSTLALVYLMWVCIKYRGALVERQLAHAELSDKGLPASIAELEEVYSNSPGSEALSLDYQPLFVRLEGVSKDLRGFVIEESTRSQRRHAGGETPLPEIEQFLLQNQDLIDLLLETTSRGGVHFPLDFHAGNEIRLDHHVGFITAQRLLRLAVHVRSAQGDSETVETLLQRMLSISLSIQGEPFLSSKLVYFATFEMFANAFFDALCWFRFDDDFFSALLTELPETDGRLHLREGLGTDAVFSRFAFEELARGEEDSKLVGDGIPSISRMIGATAYDEYSYFRGLEAYLLPRTVEAKQMHADCVRRFSQLVSLCELPWVESRSKWARCDEELYNEYVVESPVRNLVRWSIDERVAAEYHDTIIGLVRIACALERYARHHSKLPEEASMLVPEFLAALPMDSSDNDPLEYLRLVDGYLLFGGGLDEIQERKALATYAMFLNGVPPVVICINRHDLVGP